MCFDSFVRLSSCHICTSVWCCPTIASDHSYPIPGPFGDHLTRVHPLRWFIGPRNPPYWWTGLNASASWTLMGTLLQPVSTHGQQYSCCQHGPRKVRISVALCTISSIRTVRNSGWPILFHVPEYPFGRHPVRLYGIRAKTWRFFISKRYIRSHGVWQVKKLSPAPSIIPESAFCPSLRQDGCLLWLVSGQGLPMNYWKPKLSPLYCGSNYSNLHVSGHSGCWFPEIC